MRAFYLFVLNLTFILNIASAQQPSAPPAADQKSARDTQIQERDQLWLQAQTLQSEGKKKEAIAVGERVLAIERKAYEDPHEKLTDTIAWLSQQYLAQQNLPQAETYAVELQRVQEALHGKMGWQSVSARWWLDYVRKVSNVQPATLTRMLASEAEVNRLLAEGKLADAAAEIEKLILLEESTLGSDHPFFANTFVIQADCLLKAEQFAAAETAAERALSIRRKQLGDQHPDTARVAFLLARSQIGQERHTDALEPLELAHDASLASRQFINAAWMDSWRGDSLAALQRPAEAKAAYQAALAAFREQKEAKGEAQLLKRLADLDGSVDLKVERDHLGELAEKSRTNGELKEAAALGERMLAIERAWLTNDSTEITFSLGWLAVIYENLEQWGEAESRRLEILRRETTRLGETHWQVTDARLAVEHVRLLASLTDEQLSQLNLIEELASRLNKKHAEGAFSDAIPDAERICKIRKTILGERHPDYATSLNNLAFLYRSMGDNARAEPLYLQALEIKKSTLGEYHPSYATNLNNLALLYRSMGDAARAEPLYLQALKSFKAALGEHHPNYATSLHNLAELYQYMDDTAKAEPLYLRSLDIQKALKRDGHPDYASSLHNLAGLYRSMGNAAKAEPLYLQALDIRREKLGERHLDYATSLNNLAGLYDSMGDAAKAEPMYLQALDIRKEKLGERHEDYATSLNDLAGLYDKIGNAAKAEPMYLQALDIRKEKLGERHPEYATSLSNLAGLYKSMGDAAKAEPMYLQALDIRKEKLGERHPAYASSLNNLAALYDSMGDAAKAEPLYLQALEIRKIVLGEHHPDYATSLNNLAGLYESMGDAVKAEPLYLQALEIRKAVLGESHPAYATSLNNLASLYESMGDVVKAEPLYLQAMEIRKAVLRERHPVYASSLNSLAGLYKSMGDTAKAEPLYLQALEIRKTVLGERHPDYATSLNNVAALYKWMGDSAKAEPLFVKAMEIRKAMHGERHLDYATSLNNVAALYESIGDTVKAAPLYLQALEIVKAAPGERHPAYATSLNNLAGLYCSMGDAEKAEPLFLQALQIVNNVHGERHPDYASSLNNLAALYDSRGDAAKAEPLYLQALEISRDVLERTAMGQSERQQLAMGQMLRYQLDSYVSFTLQSSQFQPSAAKQVLRWKGATLVRQRAIRLAAKDPAIADRFRSLQQVSRRLASLSRTPPAGDFDDWKTKITDLTAEKEQLEAQLSRNSSVFQASMEEITAQQIQAAIPRDAVLVDYLQFTRSRPSEKKGQWAFTTSLLAVIVKPEGELLLVELGSSAELSTAVDTWRHSFGLPEAQQQAGLAIRRQIWEPLLSHIADAATILVSTDGPLGRIPLGALPGKEPGKYLLEDHRIAMVPVPQLLPALVNDAAHTATSQGLLLLGDVDYNSEAPHAAGTKATERKKRRIGEYPGDLVDVEYETLPGAAEEVELIRKLYSEVPGNKATDIQLLKQSEASEAAFRENAGKFRHIHVATHGFFAPVGAPAASSNEFPARMLEFQARGFNPDVLSGLAFAGANLQPEPGKDDGILTAQEIAFLPLNGVDTAVLSVCESGLGSSTGGEGLISVQRAFQISGVRTTVASLWEVDDRVTQFLMERFYRNLWEMKMSRLDALRDAQLYLLKNPQKVSELLRSIKRPEQPQKFSDLSPFHWAAFTLSGDWR